MTIEQKQDRIRMLSAHITRVCLEYAKTSDWEITDPARLDQYDKLLELLNHHMDLYLADAIPWDRDSVEVIEVIQQSPDSTPVSVPVKRFDFRPSVMQAARDLMILVVLP